MPWEAHPRSWVAAGQGAHGRRGGAWRADSEAPGAGVWPLTPPGLRRAGARQGRGGEDGGRKARPALQ